MSSDKPLTGVRKRQQIADTNKQILIWAGIASSLVVICVVVAINFIQDIAYQVKVNSELSNTASNLSNSVNNIPTLIKNVGNLSTNQSLNLQNVNWSEEKIVVKILSKLNSDFVPGKWLLIKEREKKTTI